MKELRFKISRLRLEGRVIEKFEEFIKELIKKLNLKIESGDQENRERKEKIDEEIQRLDAEIEEQSFKSRESKKSNL